MYVHVHAGFQSPRSARIQILSRVRKQRGRGLRYRKIMAMHLSRGSDCNRRAPERERVRTGRPGFNLIHSGSTVGF